MTLLRIGLSALALALTCGLPCAAELNPSAVTYTLPDNVKWENVPGFLGAERAVMVGENL